MRASNVDDVAPTDEQLTVPEVARRLGMPGGDVYRLLFRGELAGGPAEDGAVYVSAVSVDEYAAARQPGQTFPR
jgi:hypothetical protein